MPVTLSMGVGLNGENPSGAYEHARAAIRYCTRTWRGDQAVVKENNNLSFNGGENWKL